MPAFDRSRKNGELKSLLHRFETYLYTHCGIGKSTAALYVGTIRRGFPVFGAEPTHQQMEEFVADMMRHNYSSGYVAASCVALERFSEMRGNRIELARPPKKAEDVPTTMSEVEMSTFLNATQNLREKTMLSLLAYSGLVNKELCKLRVRDVDLQNGLLRVEAGNLSKPRNVGIPTECVALLIDYLNEGHGLPDDLLFVTKRHGYEMEPQDIRKIVRVVAKRAGISRRVWPMLLRHSLATNMIDRGAHLLTVQDQLGHVFVQSTMKYIHRTKKSQGDEYRKHAPSYL
jgi:integrase/recombinase XerD